MKVVKKVIYVAVALFCLNLTVSAQSITLKVSNITVKQAMDELKSRSGYSFVFSSADVDTGKKISVSAENQSVNAVIEHILRGQGLTYEIQGKNIILKKDISTSIDKKTKVTGTVKDQYGEAIIGANVVVKGTTVGTITDIDGNYTLDVPSGASLQVSYIGYLTQDVVTAGKNNIDINLIEDTQKLEEVVVVGYGTQRKGELTSSISSVKSEDFIQGSVQDAAQLLQGKVAGLGVVLSDGDPASSTQIMLRGVGSIATGASPLVIIDDTFRRFVVNIGDIIRFRSPSFQARICHPRERSLHNLIHPIGIISIIHSTRFTLFYQFPILGGVHHIQFFLDMLSGHISVHIHRNRNFSSHFLRSDENNAIITPGSINSGG